MPDGDRFYRQLRGTGRGWGTAYRLAGNNSDPVFIKDRVLKAIADNFRRISPESMEKAVNILQTFILELTSEKDFQIKDIQNKILLLYSRYCAEWENFSARQNFINNKRKAA